jgi:uncharacterized protein involved in tolerance to divalent cations
MSIKITEKDKKVLSKLLKKSVNKIDNIYKFEGYVVGTICGEETMIPSVFMKEMFGGPDDEDAMVWESLEQLNQLMEIYSKLNNKNALKLQSNIYRPIFAKTKEQVKEYAYGFRASYKSELIREDGDYNACVSYMTIGSIYQANEEMCKDDEDYANLIQRLDKKPLLMLSEAVQTLNQIRLDNYVAPHDVKNNVLGFNYISSTHH